MLAAAPRLVVVLIALVAVAGCEGSSKPVGPSAAQTVQVRVTPEQALVAAGETVPFNATVTGTANTAVVWAVEEAGGGTVTSAGLYTAPSAAGTFHVRATSAADSTTFAAAAVTVTAPPVVAIAVTPTTGTLNACKTLQFSATVTGSQDTSVTWSVQEGAAGGTISATGLYTAPSGPGVYHVIGTSNADPARNAVATVTVNEVILAVAVSPATVTVPPGGSAQFTATVTNTCGSFTSTSTVLSDGRIIPSGR